MINQAFVQIKKDLKTKKHNQYESEGDEPEEEDIAISKIDPNTHKGSDDNTERIETNPDLDPESTNNNSPLSSEPSLGYSHTSRSSSSGFSIHMSKQRSRGGWKQKYRSLQKRNNHRGSYKMQAPDKYRGKQDIIH